MQFAGKYAARGLPPSLVQDLAERHRHEPQLWKDSPLRVGRQRAKQPILLRLVQCLRHFAVPLPASEDCTRSICKAPVLCTVTHLRLLQASMARSAR